MPTKVAILFFLSITNLAAFSPATADTPLSTQLHAVNAATVISGLAHPWSMTWLPDGRVLIAERRGTLRVWQNGKLLPSAVGGLPSVEEHGQGGLLDLALHPNYASNGWIYWSYNGRAGALHGTEVARGKLSADGTRLTDVQVIFRMQPKSGTRQHFGSRLVFDRAGFLYITLGDRGDSPDKGTQQRAQKLDDHAGKVIRLHDDGRVPADNPFVKTPGALPEIFDLGHRNLQGAAIHPDSGKLWTHEHGPQGGDEINIESAGANYGWPIITYGVNYGTGTRIGEGTAKPGLAQPIHYWVPSIAPSGMTFYTGNRFAKWQGNLFVGALAGKMLVRLTLEGDKVVGEERLFQQQFGRIRDVRTGPDGLLYLLTDEEDGKLIRLTPASKP